MSLSTLGSMLPRFKKKKGGGGRGKGNPELMDIGGNVKFIYTCLLWKGKQK